VARDHYIPQCLTRPWHDTSIGKESLRYFDFQTGTFEHGNSGKLFARMRLNSKVTEEYLSRYIETPFSIAQDRMIAAGSNMSAVSAAFSELPRTALTGIYWLQVARIYDSRVDPPARQLESLVKRYEDLSVVFFSKFVALLFPVPSALYFPDTAIFPIPVDGERGLVYGLPVHPELVLVFAEKTVDPDLVKNVLNADSMSTALSIGLVARRIVLPPQVPNPTVSSLIRVRVLNRELFEKIAEMNRLAGLPAWRLKD
jgi:hypothetical protein